MRKPPGASRDSTTSSQLFSAMPRIRGSNAASAITHSSSPSSGKAVLARNGPDSRRAWR